MPRGVTRWTPLLGGFLGAVVLAAGVAELITQWDNPVALLVFWLPTLWGGAALILYGVFRARQSRVGVVLVVAGAVATVPATVWTVVLPLLTATLVALVVRARRESAAA